MQTILSKFHFRTRRNSNKLHNSYKKFLVKSNKVQTRRIRDKPNMNCERISLRQDVINAMTWHILPNFVEIIARQLIEERSIRPLNEENVKQVYSEQINLTNINQHNMLKWILTRINLKITDGMMKVKQTHTSMMMLRNWTTPD